MNNEKNTSRRKFLKSSTFGLGTGLVGVSLPSAVTNLYAGDDEANKKNKLPAEVHCLFFTQ